MCFNVTKYSWTIRAFLTGLFLYTCIFMVEIFFVQCEFCGYMQLIFHLNSNHVHMRYSHMNCSLTHQLNSLFIMNDHLVIKRYKNVIWKKTTRTLISSTTWAAALDPSCTPVTFPVIVFGVDVLGEGHPSRGHGGQSRGRFGFSGAHSGRGLPPPPPPDPDPEFTQWQR